MFHQLCYEQREKTQELRCRKCKSSSLHKVGKERERQEYQCKECGKRFIENPQFQSANHVLPQNITTEEMFELDIWDVRVFGLEPSTGGNYTLSFSSISCHWLRIAVKHWLKYRMSIDTTGTIYHKLSRIKKFARFVEVHQPNLISQHLNRNLIIEYLGYLKSHKTSNSPNQYISTLGQFLEACLRYGWGYNESL